MLNVLYTILPNFSRCTLLQKPTLLIVFVLYAIKIFTNVFSARKTICTYLYIYKTRVMCFGSVLLFVIRPVFHVISFSFLQYYATINLMCLIVFLGISECCIVYHNKFRNVYAHYLLIVIFRSKLDYVLLLNLIHVHRVCVTVVPKQKVRHGIYLLYFIYLLITTQCITPYTLHAQFIPYYSLFALLILYESHNTIYIPFLLMFLIFNGYKVF